LSSLYNQYSFRHTKESFQVSRFSPHNQSTMAPLSFSLLILISMLSSTLAQHSNSGTATAAAATGTATHQVAVGKNGLVFTPDTVTAAAGDTIEFTFGSGGHSVTKSNFSNPCQASTTRAIWSGYASTSDMFVLKVNNTKPIWLFCSQASHCQAGMAMVINPPYVVPPLHQFTFPATPSYEQVCLPLSFPSADKTVPTHLMHTKLLQSTPAQAHRHQMSKAA